MIRTMTLTETDALISKFEVMCAFFKTEEEENLEMALKLNKMLNVFYEIERQKQQNIISLSFNIKDNRETIDYIYDAISVTY